MKERPVRGLSKKEKQLLFRLPSVIKKKPFYVNGLKYNFYVN